MANKRITELASATTLTLNDLLVLINDAQTRKTTIQDLIDFLITQGEFAQLDNGTIPPEQLPDLTTTDVAEGSNKYYTAARVLTELLAGLSLQNSAVTSADSLLIAFGKLQGQMNAREEVSKKGTVNGYASLDGAGKVPPAQLPSSITNPLTGFATGANSTILATDTILTALQKVQGQINAREEVAKKGVANGYASLDNGGKVPTTQLPASIIGGVSYQGSWNAASALTAASASNKGWYYVVSANGTQTVDGISEWKIGDWAISNGTVWQKVDNSDPGILELLTGFVTGANSTVLATDTVLAAFQKVQGQINARELTSKKGVANGYASLDGNTRLTKALLTKGQRALDLDTSASSSSTASEVKVYSAPINSAVLAAGDQVNVRAWFSSAANANTKTIKLYINSSDSIGGTLVGTYSVPSGASSFKFERDISFLTATSAKAGVAPGTSSRNGEGTVADAAFTVPDITNTFYFVIGASGNSLTCDRVALEGLYWTTADPITG